MEAHNQSTELWIAGTNSKRVAVDLFEEEVR
jgi:hypothetical protein